MVIAAEISERRIILDMAEASERGLLRRMFPWVTLISLLAVLTGDETQRPREHAPRPTPPSPTKRLSEEELRALHTKQCKEIEVARKEARRNLLGRAPRREEFLNGFAGLISCVEFDSATYDPSKICLAVSEEIRLHPIGLLGTNSIMRPFFENLYVALACKDVGQRGSEAPPAVKELFKLLKVEITRDPPKALDPGTSIKELCEPWVNALRTT